MIEQTPAQDRGGLGKMIKKLVKKLPHREPIAPVEPIQPGYTTIFYSPFFPILPPHPPTQYNYGTPYGSAPPPYASYSGPNSYQSDDTTILTSQQQQQNGDGGVGPQSNFNNLFRV